MTAAHLSIAHQIRREVPPPFLLGIPKKSSQLGSRPNSGDFDLHQKPWVSQSGNLEHRACRQIGLLLSSEELGVALHEPGKIHLATLVWVTNEEDLHLNHVAHLQADPAQRLLDRSQDSFSLGFCITIGCNGVLLGALVGYRRDS